MDVAARDALAGFLRHEIRTELASDLEATARELEELRLRVHVLERPNGVPTGQGKGVKLRQREVARLCQEGYSRQWIATALGISQATVGKDLAVERAAAANGKPFGHGETALSDPQRS